MSLGVSLTQYGHVLPSQRYQQATRHNSGTRYNAITNPTRHNAPLQEDVSQAILDMQAREAIKDLFPKIPEKDLHDIICRAFKKVFGTKRKFGVNAKFPRAKTAWALFSNYHCLGACSSL